MMSIIAWAPNNLVNVTEGTLECNVLKYDIHLADSISCIFFKLPYILYDTKFGYFTAIFPILVILISFFGRIKLHYRWFILNLAILDFLNCYSFVCTAANDDLFSSLFMPHDDCEIEFLKYGSLGSIVESLPAIGLMLLTGSRVLSLYFSHFYKRIAKTWKIILSIIIADLFYILIVTIAARINDEREQISLDCFGDLLTNSTDVSQLFKGKRKLKGGAVVFPEPKICVDKAGSLNLWSLILMYIKISISQIALFVSIIFIIMLVIKLIQQLKFQAKTNKEMLKMNIRIVTVFSIQAFLLLFVFAVDAFLQYTSSVDLNIFFKCPFWLQWIFSQNTLKSLREIRVFLDSFIILAHMSGYREDLIDSILCLCKTPKRIFITIKYIITKKNSLTPLSMY